MEQVRRERPRLSIEMRIMRNKIPLRITKNFEQAALACKGDFIALCDQDDIWHSERLRYMAEELNRRTDLLLVHTDARLVDAKGDDLAESLFEALEVKRYEIDWIHAGQAFDMFLRRNLVTGATTVFRRSLLSDAAPFPTEWLHDEWLAIIAASVGQVDIIERKLTDYRQHDGNQIGARREAFIKKVKKALAPRGETHTQRAIKAEILLNRLLTLSDRLSPDMIDKVRAKLQHQNYRAALPVGRLARVMPVLREAATGRYDKFGRGAQGVIRDLFQSV